MALLEEPSKTCYQYPKEFFSQQGKVNQHKSLVRKKTVTGKKKMVTFWGFEKS